MVVVRPRAWPWLIGSELSGVAGSVRGVPGIPVAPGAEGVRVVLAPTVDEGMLRRLVGTQVFLLAREHVRRGSVSGVQRNEHTGHAFGQVGEGPAAQSAIAFLNRRRDGELALSSECTCKAESPCQHAVALLLATLPGAVVPAQVTPPAAWERSLAPLIGAAPPQPEAGESARLALQFEVVPGNAVPRWGSAPASPFRIGMRPVVPGRSGNWVRTGISWAQLGYESYYQDDAFDPGHVRLLTEIMALTSTDERYYGYHEKTLYLESVSSRRIWDLLAEARELGLPLIQAGKREVPVSLHAESARISIQVARSAAGLELVPQILIEDAEVLVSASMLLGEPAHGVAWWQFAGEAEPEAKDRVLRLAPLDAPLDAQVKALLGTGRIQIPARDETTFLQNYYPALRRRVGLTPADESVELPEALPPVLSLTVDRLDGHRVALAWQWVYAVGGSQRHEPLWLGAGPGTDRDRAAESETIRQVTAAVGPLPELLAGSLLGPRLAPAATLSGITMIRLLNDVLPVLAALPGVTVTLNLDQPDGAAPAEYREAASAPLVIINTGQKEGERDWFDLAVAVSVDGEEVPFNDLFVALAQQHEHLILPSGTYFTLDRPEFHQLAALIAEARALHDGPAGAPGTVRLSRFQAGLWAELEQIGVISGQAAAWQESVRALSQAGELVEHPPPSGLNAELRPYQVDGFRWLVTLFRLGLGGVLADDMGLGKTLQTLALICHAREQGLSDGPFLVVAPTSVVFNWGAEVAKFAPGLTVAAISETRARRRAELAEAIAGADIVVTSYTLFRLEYEAYAAVSWAGLVLDEAQFVKNHQSQSYQAVKKLPAPFKLAITGTPMENNLMELWSLLSITAPGLFANPARFTQYYRTPIEKGKDAELLAQLRRRIRPLMLRRTKEQVATDLPDKQEQVIELELNPKHRKVYQTHLQRERQKVLGLLDDLGKNRFEIFRSLTLLRQASLDVGLIDPEYAKIPSTKLDAMMELVDDIAVEGHRTLIFSQFTRFLDSARHRLEAAGIEYCYLDGSTRDRASVLAEFKSGTAPVFLISLKAGGFGLNLTEADYVILLDPWWNPATEAQAVDRVHRIGQTKKVMVYRLVAKDTIEQKVMALKATKAALFSSVMDDGAFESAVLSASDIRELLG
jgi:superfamily II DNA or RNA helicase